MIILSAVVDEIKNFYGLLIIIKLGSIIVTLFTFNVSIFKSFTVLTKSSGLSVNTEFNILIFVKYA